MPLIKEDGSIVTDANSYANAADADAFQLNRGRAAWCNSGADVKDAALIRATDYIEGRFALSFAGCAIDDVQTLSWPRTAAHYPATGNDFPIDEVPLDVVNATILYRGGCRRRTCPRHRLWCGPLELGDWTRS